MNKYFKVGLFLQIPNLVILLAAFFAFVFFRIDWAWLFANSIVIIIGTIYALINIASIIYLIAGASVTEKRSEDLTEY